MRSIANCSEASLKRRMKDNLNDPNNHVPDVSEDDDWDDAVPDTQLSESGIPPRRAKRTHSSQKEAAKSSVARDDGQNKERRLAVTAEREPKERLTVTAVNSKNAANSPAKASAQKRAGKATREAKATGSSRNAAKLKKKQQTVDSEAISTAEPQESSASSERVVLPPLPEGRPNRLVHSIGTGKSSDSDVRPKIRLDAKKTIQKAEVSGESDEEKIARMRHRFVKGERGDWGAAKSGHSNKWMVYTGLGVVALVILAVVLSQMLGRKEIRPSDSPIFSQLAAPEVEDDLEEDDDVGLLAFLTGSQADAKVIYAQYATAKSGADLAKILVNAEAVLPILKEKWEPMEARTNWAPDENSQWSVHHVEGMRYGILSGTSPDFSAFNAVFQVEDEVLKLDWKATTGFSSAEFAELKAGKGDATEVRSVVSLADFYTFALPEERYRAYRLMSMDGELNVWGYTEIGSALDDEISELFLTGQITGEVQSARRLLLSLERGSDDTLPNQWIIKDLISKDWLDQKTK